VLASDADLHGSPLGFERLGQRRVVLTGTEISAPKQQVVELVRAARRAAELVLHLLEGSGVD